MTAKPRTSIGARRNPASADAILEAAEAVLLENGYSGFSIEAVARRARAGKPTIYRWWPSKAALLLDVYQRQKRDVVIPDTGNVEEDVFVFLTRLFRHWRDTPAGSIFRSLIAEAQSDDTAAAALAAYTEGRRAHTGRIVENAVRRGDAPPSADARAFADLVGGYVWYFLLTNRLDAGDDDLRRIARLLAAGVRTKPES